MNTIKPYGKSSYIPPEEALRQIQEIPIPEPSAESLEFKIEELPEWYRLRNVPYNGGLYEVDWSKRLLDNGKARTQDEWVRRTDRIEWKLPNLCLSYASLLALYTNRDCAVCSDLVKKVVEEVFMPDLRNNNLYTSTRVIYLPEGKDVVIHDIGYQTETRIETMMAGIDVPITANCAFEDEVAALLGTRNTSEVEQVYNWVKVEEIYLYRENDRPKKEVLRALTLGLKDYELDTHWPARGVVARKTSERE